MNLEESIGKILEGKPRDKMPEEEFFRWLVVERVSSRGPEFSLALRASAKQARIAASHAHQQKNPAYEKAANEYADALETVSRYNAAHSLAVIEELERLVRGEGETPPVMEQKE